MLFFKCLFDDWARAVIFELDEVSYTALLSSNIIALALKMNKHLKIINKEGLNSS